MPAVAPQLIGRKDELAQIVALLDAPASLPGAVVLHGEAGIGKTAVWLAGVASAAERGFLVLSSRPSEAETRFAYAGLTDLLAGIADDVLPDLPALQRRALEAALLLSEFETRAEERAVAAALLGVVQRLGRRRPLCLAVDDLQWLDPASLTALRFAVARLTDERVLLLLTIRGEVPQWLSSAVEDALIAAEFEGLSVGALRELLRTRLDATYSRPMLLRLHETSRGNPFFALELARALGRRGDPSLTADEPLPLPATLQELVEERLADLGPESLEVARVVAASAAPTADLVTAALPMTSEAALGELLDARILEFDGSRVRFTHPLLASAVAADELPSRRRRLHARLAEVVPAAEERARHLALATDEPSAATAAVIEEAARRAAERGACSEAAELAGQALRLTPPASAEDAGRRLILTAEQLHASGDTEQAVAVLEHARDTSPPGRGLAAILLELARVVRHEPRKAEALLLAAVDETEGDAFLAASVQLELAELMRWGAGIDRGADHAAQAARAALQSDDLELHARALTSQVCWQCRAGRGLARAQLDEAIALERGLPGWPLTHGPAQLAAMELMWIVELAEARALLHEVLDLPRLRVDAAGEEYARWILAMVEWRAGRWDEAEEQAARASELATQLGRPVTADLPGLCVAAHRGHVELVRETAVTLLARSGAIGVQIEEATNHWLLGFLELSVGDAAAALPHLVRGEELRDRFMLEPAMRLGLGDLLEALVATGALEEAEEVLARWRPRATVLDRPWALAIVARGSGLLLAARGELEPAFASFDRALAEHARDADPFQHARTLLALGRTQRRAKKRGAARTTLEDALARFEALGAPLWAEQTRAELARIGGRAPSRGELTEAERRIVEVVTQGSTNKQVAAALFLTEHSVETALTRIYRKLGVRSRGELTRQLAERR